MSETFDLGTPPPREEGMLFRAGRRVSDAVARLAAHPLVQIGFALFCVAWFVLELPTDLLTATLSILAITLTQMVLNRQDEREAEAHRRDLIMHAKLDELVAAQREERIKLAEVERLEKAEIAQLKAP